MTDQAPLLRSLCEFLYAKGRGLDEDETQEFIALAGKKGNPHHKPRYRELWEKYDRTALLAGFQKSEE